MTDLIVGTMKHINMFKNSKNIVPPYIIHLQHFPTIHINTNVNIPDIECKNNRLYMQRAETLEDT